jgi:beta-lactamase superfamily II metal-dependent hydrolase
MRRKFLAGAGLCVLVGLFLCLSQPARGSASPVITFINIGQGDSALLQDGSGFNVLIDGGVPGEGPTVLAYLRSHGAAHLNIVLASHADSDHVGGLIDVLEAPDIQVDKVLYNGYPGSTQTWQAFWDAALARGLTPEAVQFPKELVWGNMTAYVLNPAAGLTNPDQNKASEVIRVDEGGLRTLFAGDIDATIEATVVARKTPIASQVLKVAHHGSTYGSSAGFLAAAQPRVGVISVGPNTYGHPSAQTVSRLLAAGAAIYRTDISGNIQVVSESGGNFTLIPQFSYQVYLPLLQR